MDLLSVGITLVAGGIVAQGIHLMTTRFMESAAERRDDLSGPWIQTLFGYPPDREPRTDEVKCRRRGNRVRLKIHRMYPADETRKRWKAYGYVSGEILVVTFVPITSAARDAQSFGSIVLHRVMPSAEKSAWAGLYIRPASEEYSDFRDCSVGQRAILWERPDQAKRGSAVASRSHSVLEGRWVQSIEPFGEEPSKRDVVECRVRGESGVVATVVRQLPENQAGKRWKFIGKVDGAFFRGNYSGVGRENEGSRGTMQLAWSEEGHSWRGFYTKYDERAAGDSSESILRIPVVWTQAES